MNRFLFFLTLLICGFSVFSQMPAPPKLQRLVKEFSNDTCFRSAGVGIVISDAKPGKILAENQPFLNLTPASTQKLITTATALELLGSKYKFKTEIATDGEILENGTLKGNLIVKGYGDPTLGSEYFENEKEICVQIVERLKSLNIRSIYGRIITDASYIKSNIPATWVWEDIGNYYGAVPHGISYRDNFYTLIFESGEVDSLTKIKETIPQNTGLEFENLVVGSDVNRDLAYIFGGNTGTKRRIEGSIPKNRSDFAVKGASLFPELLLVEDLQKALSEEDILLESQDFGGSQRRTLFTIHSPDLKEIVKLTNQKSINLFADHLLHELGKKEFGEPNWKNGIKSIKHFWNTKGIDTRYIELYDGSGLSHFNAISASFLNQLLGYMYKSQYANEFMESLAVAGKSGTLESFGKQTVIEGNWKAKTGSMTGVRGYCGYLTTKNGKVLSITILINNYSCSSSVLSSKVENFLSQLSFH